MKIVTWNCIGALRKKVSELDTLDADPLVVQECENPAESAMVYRE
jgi:exodeoxyribonuclease-3